MREIDFGSYCMSDKMNLVVVKMCGIYFKLGVLKFFLIILLLFYYWIEINMGWMDYGM